jgi:hypothetical protein
MKTEKNIYRILLVLAAMFLFTYCDNYVDSYDSTPPSPPENVQTYVGDGQVEISWNDNPERDIAGYNIYYSFTYWGDYELIGNTKGTYFVDTEANNGELYYYAVAAYDYDGNESELSYDEVYGVARPEGMNQTIFDYLRFPDVAGYDFSEYQVVPYNAYSDEISSDFFFENYSGGFYLNVWEDTDIQDMGFTERFTDITFAPLEGWTQMVPGDNIKYTLAEVGHTYIIWTWDNHFAKIRVKSISGERIVFDWAYQLLEGEQQLKTSKTDTIRKEIPKQVIKN